MGGRPPPVAPCHNVNASSVHPAFTCSPVHLFTLPSSGHLVTLSPCCMVAWLHGHLAPGQLVAGSTCHRLAAASLCPSFCTFLVSPIHPRQISLTTVHLCLLSEIVAILNFCLESLTSRLKRGKLFLFFNATFLQAGIDENAMLGNAGKNKCRQRAVPCYRLGNRRHYGAAMEPK